jgi:large subunit ribosomal protein L16
MGMGKGEPEYWAAVIRPGTVLFELAGVNEEFAKQIFNNVAHKMSLTCKLVDEAPCLRKRTTRADRRGS